VSFGVLSVAAGLSVAQTCFLSAVTFTGASQFTYVSVIGAGGGIGAALPPSLLLAARNGVYALSLRSVLQRGWRRARDAHFVIDETTAMALAQDEPSQQRRAFVVTGVALWLFWNLGTLIGALAGDVISDPRDLGLDALFPAVFIALLAPQMRRAGAPSAAALGALVAFVLIPLTPAGVPAVAAAAAAIPLLAYRRRR
jgi:4-azaleucine resistance transporter AzlC